MPEEAVRAYHGVLQAKGIPPRRSLEEDLGTTDMAMSYDGSAARHAVVEIRNNPLARTESKVATPEASGQPAAKDWPKLENGSPDFAHMDSAQRLAYDASRFGW
jgi:hypothetical protein